MVEPRGGGGGCDAATARTSMVRSPAGRLEHISGVPVGVGGGERKGGLKGGEGGRWGGMRLTQVAEVFNSLVQDGIHGGVLVDGSGQQLRDSEKKEMGSAGETAQAKVMQGAEQSCLMSCGGTCCSSTRSSFVFSRRRCSTSLCFSRRPTPPTPPVSSSSSAAVTIARQQQQQQQETG
jgi:hypothetical protein